MTEPNEIQQPDSPESPTSPKPKKRRGRKLLIGGVVLLLLLVGLVALLPTLASTGVGRDLVLGQINNSIVGRVEAESLSVGWFSGATLGGVELYDDEQDQLVLHADLATELTLLDALTYGDLDFGQSTLWLNMLRAEVNEAGELNYVRLLSSTEPSDSETAIPVITGRLKLELEGRIDHPTGSVELLKNEGFIDFGDGEAVAVALNLPLRDDQGASGTIAVNGEVAVPPSGFGDLSSLAADGDVRFEDVELSLLRPVLKMAGVDAEATGVLDGMLVAETDGSRTTVKVELPLTDLRVTNLGPDLPTVDIASAALTIDAALDSDTATVSPLTVTVDGVDVLVANVVGPTTFDGTALPSDFRGDVKLNLSPRHVALLSAFVPEESRAALQGLTITADTTIAEGRATVAANIDGPEGQLLDANLAASGTADVLDLTLTEVAVWPSLAKRFAADLPATVDGQPIRVTGGGQLNLAASTFTPSGTLRIESDGMTVAQDGAELLAGQPLRIELTGPIGWGEVPTVDAVAVIVGGGRGLLREAVLSASNVSIGEATTADVNLDFVRLSDLNRLRPFLGDAVADTTFGGDISISGGGRLDLGTNTFTPTTPLEVRGSRVSVAYDGSAILADQDLLVSIDGPASWGETTKLKQATLRIESGDGALSNLSVAVFDVEQGESVQGTFDLTELAVNDLAAALGPFAEQLPVVVESGGLYAAGAGSFDSATMTVNLSRPIEASLPNLTVSQDGQRLLDRQKLYLRADGTARGDGFDVRDLLVRLDDGRTAQLTATGNIGAAATDGARPIELAGTLGYDLDALTPTLRAVSGDALADAVMEGVAERLFKVGGTTAEPTFEGGLTLPRVAASGVDVRNLALDLVYSNGGLAVRQPEPAAMNSGTLSLDGLNIDLSGEEPLLFVSRPKTILQNVQLNPVLAEAAGPYLSQFLASSDSATGDVTLSIDSSRRFPLSAALTERGSLDMTLTLDNLDIEGDAINLVGSALADAVAPGTGRAVGGNDLLGGLAELNRQLGGKDGPLKDLAALQDLTSIDRLRGFVKNADAAVTDGILRQDITFNAFDPRDPDATETYPLQIAGTVNLQTLEIDQRLILPRALLEKWLPDELFAVVPAEGLTVQYTGTTSNPGAALGGNLDGLLQGAVRRMIAKEAGGDAGQAVGDLLDPNKDPAEALGGLLRGVLGEDEEE
jgi:hypothetical protein